MDKINNINLNNIYPNETLKPVEKQETASSSRAVSSPISEQYPSSVHFNGFFSDLLNNSKFKNSNDKKMYKAIYDSIDKPYQKNLDKLLQTGKLLQANSSDGSSTLQNLYKILATPRAQGLNGKLITEETIRTLANPFLINQNFGDVPTSLTANVLNTSKMHNITKSLGLNSEPKPNTPHSAEDINVLASGTCVAASMEFNLADKKTAEFVRYVEGLTSPEMNVKTNIHYSDISDNLIDAVTLLKEFDVEFKTKDWNNLEVTLKPDEEAIQRARIQSKYRDPGERSLVDALMQATFMQLGSQNTYNSLTDKRYGKFNPNEKGLTEFEKNFTETIVDHSGGKTSVTYQQVDDEARLAGYNHNYETVKKHILDTLATGQNIIIGITEVQEPAKLTKNGQELSLTDITYVNNNPVFNCIDKNNSSIQIEASRLAGTSLNIEGEKFDIVDVVNDKSGLKFISKTPNNKFVEMPASKLINALNEINKNAYKILGGHEMTIINTNVDKNGELYFVCNDTDDDYNGAVEIKAKDLIPKIHHAGIPNNVLHLPKEPHVSIQLLREYEQLKKEQH